MLIVAPQVLWRPGAIPSVTAPFCTDVRVSQAVTPDHAGRIGQVIGIEFFGTLLEVGLYPAYLFHDAAGSCGDATVGR